MSNVPGIKRNAARVVLAALVGSIALIGTEPLAADPMTDLSAVSGAPPRMFIIMDTSRSMRFDPAYQNQYPGMDYDGQPFGAAGGSFCGESGPTPQYSPPIVPVLGVPASTVTGADEYDHVQLDCGPGGTITSIEWAVYGKRTGHHRNFPSNPCAMASPAMINDNGGCVGPGPGWSNVKAAFNAACVGHSSCTVSIDNATMNGDPCVGVGKYALAKFSCSADPCPPGLGSKFCIAKKALYRTVAEHEKDNGGEIDMAGAGYYQLLWRAHHPEDYSDYTTTCAYDTFAAAGTTNSSNSVSTSFDDGHPSDNLNYACHPEVIDPAGLGAICSSAQPAHVCRKTEALVTEAHRFQHDVAAHKADRPNVTYLPPPGNGWGWPPGGTPPDRATDPKYFRNDANSFWDTTNYLYVRRSSLGTCAPTPATTVFTDLTAALNPWGAGNAQYGTPANLTQGIPPDCTAGNVCAYFSQNHSEVIADEAVTVYTDHGPAPVTIGVTTYSNRGTPAPSGPRSILANDPALGGTCPATVPGYTNGPGFPGCTAGNPCDLTRVGASAAPIDHFICPDGWMPAGTDCTRSETAYNPGMNVAVPYHIDSHPPVDSTAPALPTGSPGYDELSYTLSLSEVMAGHLSCLSSPTVVAGPGQFPAANPGVKTRTIDLACGNDNLSFPGTCQLDGASTWTNVAGTPVYGTVNTDLGEVTCTIRRYKSTFTAIVSAVNEPYCRYRRTAYTYYNTADFCQYQRFDFTFAHKEFTYRWDNNDGDYLGSFTVQPPYPNTDTSVAADRYCASDNTPQVALTYLPGTGFVTPGNASPRCPVELAPGSEGCPPGVLRCKLRWNDLGRFGNFLDASGGYATPGVANWPQPDNFYGTGRSFCQLKDYLPQGLGAGNQTSPGYIANWTHWCNTTGHTYTPAYDDPPKLIADFFGTQLGSDFGGGYWGSGPSLPPLVARGDSFSPPLRTTKDRGLSMGNLTPLTGTLAPAQPAQSFIGFDDSVANLGSLFRTYTGDGGNPYGLRMPDHGDITPLTGALKNARDYIDAVKGADGGVCHRYSVLLLTDGDEFPTADPVGAVTDLKNDGVPVYVVGFGVQSPTLDNMARAAGTDLDGGAYSANDYTTLKASLDDITSKQLAGLYSRTKPLVTNDGKRLYIGYFETIPDGGASQEYYGYLDAWAITGAVTSKDWAFNQKLAAQTSYNNPSATSNPRKVYTTYDGGTLVDFDVSGGCSTLVTEMMGGCATAAANEAVRFVRNDLSPRGTFTSGVEKRSRVSDIYHSQPAVAGAPFYTISYTKPTPFRDLGGNVSGFEPLLGDTNFNHNNLTTAYQSFVTAPANANKEQTVFVQSNTGTVHAIRDRQPAASLPNWVGEERWSFVPRQVLNRLAASRGSHQWLTDGAFGLQDVCFGGHANCERTDGTRWSTLLVGTLGRGGPYLFALDVTTPNAPQWLWDFNSDPSHPDDPDMLETWAAPVIARVKVDSDYYRWGVFMGSGFSNGPRSTDDAYFYVLDADPANKVGRETRPLQDTAGKEAKFPVEADNLVHTGFLSYHQPKNNIPARARVVRPNDGSRASRVYFGDTDGKLWRMDVTSDKIVDWEPKRMFNPLRMNHTNGGGCSKPDLKQLPDKGSTVRSFGSDTTIPLITPSLGADWPHKLPSLFGRPYLGIDQATRKTLVYAGSGDPNSPNDIGTQNYFWAVEDTEGDTGTCEWGHLRWGYYLDRSSGDKVLSDPVIVGPNIIVAVFRPQPDPTPSVCGDQGYTFLYCFDRHTGDPQRCLIDTSAGGPIDPLADGTKARYVKLGEPGIAADLTVVGNTIFTSTDTHPDKPLPIGVTSSDNGFRIKSWRRVR